MKSYLTHIHSQTVKSLEFTKAIKLTAVQNNISLKYSGISITCVKGVILLRSILVICQTFIYHMFLPQMLMTMLGVITNVAEENAVQSAVMQSIAFSSQVLSQMNPDVATDNSAAVVSKT